MAEDLVTIGIALETAQVLAGTRQVQTAMQQLAQSEKQAQTATQQLQQSSTAAAQALGQESQAAQATSQALRQDAQATQALQQATQALQQATRTATQILQQATQALKQTDQAAGAVGRQVGTLGGAMQSFGRQVGAFAVAQAGVLGVQQALATMQSALTDVVRTGLQLSQLRSSFTAIAGSTQAGTKEWQFAVRTANQLGVEVTGLAQQYRSLSAATRGTSLEGAATREIFTTLTRAAQAYGLSSEQLGRASTALQQILSKGKVSLEELRGQLAEAIPGAMQIAARAYGTTTAALEDMVSKGVEGTEFIRKFIAQLGTEAPQAAARAGKGIQQFGNEIVLLKDRIAQSGVIAFLDSALGKYAELLRRQREAGEKEDARVQKQAGRGLAEGVTRDTMAAQEAARLEALTRQLRAAEAVYREKAQRQAEGTVFGIKTETQVAKERVAALTQEIEALKGRANFQTLERQEQERRRTATQAATTAQQAQVEELVSAEKQLKTQLDASKKSQDDFNKAAALMPELFGKATGTLQEQLRFLEARKKVTEASLKDLTEALVARKPGMGPVPPELEAQKSALQASYREDTAAIERTKQALEDLDKAKRQAAQDDEERQRKKKQHDEEEARLDKQQAEEVARTHFQNIEQLRRMAAQYTEVKTSRDADTASVLAQSLATSQYREEAAKALEVIKASTQALEDQRKTEAKLPKLREQAEISSGRLADINRIMKSLEPSKRTTTREEQFAAKRAELAALTDDAGTLAKADTKIREALDTERWHDWRDAGLDAMDDLSSALTDFAFHGKASFADFVNSAAEDLFRLASSQALKSLFTSETGQGAMAWVMKLFGVATKAASVASGTGAGAFVGGDAPGMQHGGTAYAGRPYWVGEAGPELVIPKQTSTVIPHSQSMAMAAPTINLYVQGVTDAQSFVASRGAVQRGIAQAVAQSYRAM